MLDTKTLVAAMARRCGLEDPDRFALAGGVAAKSSAFRDAIARLTGKPWAPPKDLEHALRLRGTGRTTRMLLEVLVALQCGCKVDIVTYNDHAAVDLGSDLVALCVAGKIDMTSFHYRIRTPTSKISIVGENATQIHRGPACRRGVLLRSPRRGDGQVAEARRADRIDIGCVPHCGAW